MNPRKRLVITSVAVAITVGPTVTVSAKVDNWNSHFSGGDFSVTASVDGTSGFSVIGVPIHTGVE